ncbi:MtnX-like HAD-IB family phosphatase [bacterium]|nr:MtnX-like HAD-IB family phosphatase [bacterium]
MADLIIVCDFDGTITKEDSLYNFFKEYAKPYWLEIEKMWQDGKIGSRECLKKQFDLIENLTPELIEEYTDKIEIDDYFKEFNELRLKCNKNLIIVSDGVDYFINKILQKNDIKGIEIVSNHAEFINGKFTISFPNGFQDCQTNSGTCKCKIVKDLKSKYKKVVYIGDGASDFCVATCADLLFAKSSLLTYCKNKDINCIEYQNFKGVIDHGCI